MIADVDAADLNAHVPVAVTKTVNHALVVQRRERMENVIVVAVAEDQNANAHVAVTRMVRNARVVQRANVINPNRQNQVTKNQTKSNLNALAL